MSTAVGMPGRQNAFRPFRFGSLSASCAPRGQREVYEPRNEAFWREWAGSQQVQRQHQNSAGILAQLCGFVLVRLGWSRWKVQQPGIVWFETRKEASSLSPSGPDRRQGWAGGGGGRVGGWRFVSCIYQEWSHFFFNQKGIFWYYILSGFGL